MNSTDADMNTKCRPGEFCRKTDCRGPFRWAVWLQDFERSGDEFTDRSSQEMKLAGNVCWWLIFSSLRTNLYRG